MFVVVACCAISEQFAFTVTVQACKYCVGRGELPILAVPAQTGGGGVRGGEQIPCWELWHAGPWLSPT